MDLVAVLSETGLDESCVAYVFLISGNYGPETWLYIKWLALRTEMRTTSRLCSNVTERIRLTSKKGGVLDQEPKNWVQDVDAAMKKRMVLAADACFDNGRRLLADAITLKAGERYPSAVALAVLAEEEFAKSMLIGLCAWNNRWDSVVNNALTRHNDKQALSAGMKHIVEQIQAHISANDGSPLTLESLVAHSSAATVEASKVKDKKSIDRLKQNAIYVGISRTCEITSKPCVAATEQHASGAISAAEKGHAAAVVICKELGIGV